MSWLHRLRGYGTYIGNHTGIGWPGGARVVGLIEGVLAARLILLLFAARPDHLFIRPFLAASGVLVWPWTWLDRLADQPREGARLELATLATMATVALLAGLWQWYRSRRVRAGGSDDG